MRVNNLHCKRLPNDGSWNGFMARRMPARARAANRGCWRI
jgi:hypothetical protein